MALKKILTLNVRSGYCNDLFHFCKVEQGVIVHTVLRHRSTVIPVKRLKRRWAKKWVRRCEVKAPINFYQSANLAGYDEKPVTCYQNFNYRVAPDVWPYAVRQGHFFCFNF